MKIYRAYKFRLYPNEEQKTIINQTLGCARSVYNHYLTLKKEAYEKNHQTITVQNMIKDIPNLTIDKPWLKEVDSMSLRTSLFDLENAYQKFYKEKKGYPKHKSKYQKNSYRTNCVRRQYKGKTYENIKVDIKNHTITLPKLKEMEIRGYRKTKEIKGRIIHVTVSREAGKYYVSVLYEQEIEEKKQIEKRIVGIDLGIKTLITTSNGEKIKNEKAIQKYENKIKNLQKWLSRKQKGSNNYYKVKEKIQRVYQKLRNARKYYLHHITKKLIEENDIIVAEKLQVKKMIEEKQYSKGISDASFSEIIRQLTYKSRWKNKKFYQVDPYYASSQICHHCGHKNKQVKEVKIREWECENCHYELERDLNAAINIMGEGLEKYLKEQYS